MSPIRLRTDYRPGTKSIKTHKTNDFLFAPVQHYLYLGICVVKSGQKRNSGAPPSKNICKGFVFK